MSWGIKAYYSGRQIIVQHLDVDYSFHSPHLAHPSNSPFTKTRNPHLPPISLDLIRITDIMQTPYLPLSSFYLITPNPITLSSTLTPAKAR
jgi:hypothetical protein